MYDKKKQKIILAAVIMVIGAAISFAALQAKAFEAKNNVFSFAKGILAELDEPNWEASKGLQFVPGMTVKKDPILTNCSKDAAEYGAIRVSFQYGDRTLMRPLDVKRLLQSIKIDWNTGAGDQQWYLAQGTLGDSSQLIFIYNKKLQPGEVTIPLFQTVSMKTGSEGLTEAELRWLQKMQIKEGQITYDLEDGLGTFYIVVDGAVVHSSGYTSAKDSEADLIGLFPIGN